MNRTLCRSVLMCSLAAPAALVTADPVSPVRSEPAVTIYNRNFAVVRENLALDLKDGLNRIAMSDTTAQVEPDSVVLRDPSGKRQIQIVEQSYRADPVSQPLLLSLYEGKTIDFRVQRGDKTEIVRGKIIRSGYVPAPPAPRDSSSYQQYLTYGQPTQPVIEVDGQLRFSLPGEPVFPALPEDAILKPTLNWVLRSEGAGPVAAELAYITGGLTWKADYNIVAPEDSSKGGEALDMTGWVTLTNTSGKTFNDARVKLMAGDVNKVATRENREARLAQFSSRYPILRDMPGVTEKAFDEYHLYSLNDKTTLRDRETKQVEFIRASGVKTQRVFLYDGVLIDRNRYGYSQDSIHSEQGMGTQFSPKVMVLREFVNTTANGLGMPMPAGRMRFYRRDTTGQLEFTGENNIDHTPQGETVRVFTGNAFDVVGSRTRTDFKLESGKNSLDESFSITVTNRNKEAMEVRVLEHLYRWSNWTIPAKSNAYVKQDADTIEFRVQVPADGTQTVTYTVHYSW